MVDLIDAPSLGTFQEHEGSTFSLEDDDGGDLELAAVEVGGVGPHGIERFTLVFRGDAELQSGTYRLSADGLDEFDVGLSPTPRLDPATADGPDAGSVEYEAVFTRPNPDAADGSSNLQPDGGATMSPSGNSYTGGVDLFAGNFAPRGYMKCAGQLLQVSQYNALFSLLGSTFGGDGRTSFGLPDLRGRAPIGMGNGPGLTQRRWGERGGRETVSLTDEQLAPHTHGSKMNLPVSSSSGDATSPDGNALAAQPRGASNPIYTTEDTDGSMAVDGSIAPDGGGGPHQNMSPFLAMTYVICVNGLYPPRN